MRSPFSPKTGSWEIEWPGRVSRHDLVYLSPPLDPMQGIPLGNGDVGALCWLEESRLILALNKCDLWDDAPFGRFHNWKPEEEEHSTTLRHAGRLTVDYKLPVFDPFYLSDFRGRLSLADASASISASSPLGTVSITLFVSHGEGIVCLRMQSRLKEEVPVELRLERYGSRTFSHWYAQVNRDPTIGLEGTSTACDESGAYLSHRLSTGAFAVGLRVIQASGGVTYAREHSHCAMAAVAPQATEELSAIVGISSPSGASAPEKDATAEVKELLDRAEETGVEGLLRNHCQAWKGFWSRSLMECGDDYLDNLWHLTMYYACASQRGPYPGRFINGLWGWNRDVQNWCFYFHWNQQELYWPLNAAGHHDLVSGYLEYRFASLEPARQDAREVFGSEGAVVSDVCDRRGFNSASEFLNHTPVAQIAMDFLRQYRYTGDRDFLERRAAPYILEAARFFSSLFQKEPDGRYHAREATGYEGWIKLSDCISELVYGRVLLQAAIEIAQELRLAEPKLPQWTDIVEKLAPLPLVDAEESCIARDGGVLSYRRGFFQGEEAPSVRLLAAGFGIEEKRLLSSKIPNPRKAASFEDPDAILLAFQANDTPSSFIQEDMKVFDGIFPFVEYSAVYPSGFVGLSQKGTELFKTAEATAKLYAPDCMGWDPLPLVLARLGLGRELGMILANWPKRWQFFCNGFGHYGPKDFMRADSALRFRTNKVRDTASKDGRTFLFPSWPFRHMGMESMSVLSAAMNEALLQSHGGIVRIAPATWTDRPSRFTLHAEGGFVVSAEIEARKPLWVSVEARQGGPCRLENPWGTAHVLKNGRYAGAGDDAILILDCEAGDFLMLGPEREGVESWELVPHEPSENGGPKTDSSGKAQLGLPRMF